MAWLHFLEYGGVSQGVTADSFYNEWPATDTKVNEFAMKYGLLAGQLYPAEFDISPGAAVGKNIIEVPMGLPSSEMTAKQE